MSFDALAWAAKQRPSSSGMKLVLLGLAECADRAHNLAFPSIASLVEFSALNRKSVIANLDRLEEEGLITDTGRKVGKTGQIKVYKLNIETVPKTEPSQKRNSSENDDNSPKNGTRNQSKPVNTEAKASSERVVAAWIEMAKKHPKVASVRVLDNSRKQSLLARLKEHGEAVMLEAVEKFGANPWLTGESRDSKWRPSIDFILQPSSLRKVLEGAYGEDEEVRRTDSGSLRDSDLRTAAIYDRQGRHDEANELRRRWENVETIGSVASKIFKRAANE